MPSWTDLHPSTLYCFYRWNQNEQVYVVDYLNNPPVGFGPAVQFFNFRLTWMFLSFHFPIRWKTYSIPHCLQWDRDMRKVWCFIMWGVALGLNYGLQTGYVFFSILRQKAMIFHTVKRGLKNVNPFADSALFRRKATPQRKKNTKLFLWRCLFT